MSSTADQDSNGPAFVAWNFRDFDDATGEWDSRTVGVYVRLLHWQARRGSIPIGDIRHLASLVHEDEKAFAEMWVKALRSKFPPADDDPQRGVNPRMERERSKANRKAAISRRNGRGGGRPKKPSGLAGGVPDSLSPSPSSGSESSEIEVSAEEKALDATLGAGLPDWATAILREFLAHRIEVAAGRRSMLKVPGSPKGWTQLGRELALAGEDVAREALDELLASGWDRLSNALRAVQERRAKAPRGSKPNALHSLGAKVKGWQEDQRR